MISPHDLENRYTGAGIIAMSRLVLDAFGEAQSSCFGRNSRMYRDGTVVIRSDFNGLDLEITRMPMPAQGMPGTNPCIMIRKGEVIREHGEQRYISDHLANLVAIIQGNSPD